MVECGISLLLRALFWMLTRNEPVTAGLMMLLPTPHGTLLVLGTHRKSLALCRFLLLISLKALFVSTEVLDQTSLNLITLKSVWIRLRE